ncbi:hypothetical protein WOLCODRAFT_80539, partial [Wolfiporia cocos MD-104 SS10]
LEEALSREQLGEGISNIKVGWHIMNGEGIGVNKLTKLVPFDVNMFDMRM